jgi:hypothetical protein
LRTGSVALMYLGSQSEETIPCICKQSLSCGSSQSAVRHRWLSLCTVWLSHSQITSISMASLALGKARSRREPNLGCGGADRPVWYDALPKKSLNESCWMGRRIVMMKLICSLSHCEKWNSRDSCLHHNNTPAHSSLTVHALFAKNKTIISHLPAHQI